MSQMKEVLTLLEDCYGLLGNSQHSWPGRNTPQGQNLLNRLQDVIGKATGQSGQEVRANLDSGDYDGIFQLPVTGWYGR